MQQVYRLEEGLCETNECRVRVGKQPTQSIVKLFTTISAVCRLFNRYPYPYLKVNFRRPMTANLPVAKLGVIISAVSTLCDQQRLEMSEMRYHYARESPW